MKKCEKRNFVKKRISIIKILAVLTASCAMVLTGCAKSTEELRADMTKVETDISTVSVSSDVKLVGLGEASHGASQYQQMKKEVFQALVEHNGCRTFVIEGDFGGALKVDAYINGEPGQVKDVVREIQFGIYRTEEMVDLVEWMKKYNQSAQEGQKLHFYGMDMQRVDNSKEYLFRVLDAFPSLFQEYITEISKITNDNRFSHSKGELQNINSTLIELIEQMDIHENDIVSVYDKKQFDFAKECANAMHDYCEILIANDTQYNRLRDESMYNRIQWIMQQGDGSVVFMNGHNGHIGKTSVAGYECLGKLLNENMGNAYFAIGTDAGEYVAIMGESGSGKTTLLNILATLDKPTAGEVMLNGKNIVSLKENEISSFRRDNLGFVFQDFNLLDNFSLRDYIFLPLVLQRVKPAEMKKRLEPIANQLGIEKILDKYPYEVSGGQKQRVAVARALITGPQLILADEPTGALDSKATHDLLKLFNQINQTGQTILMVTHSTKAASHANRILFIKDGEVFHQLYRGNMTNEELYAKISTTLTMLTVGREQSKE